MVDIKELAKEDYMKGVKQKEICKKYNIKNNTLKSWITREKWSEEKRNRGAPKVIGGAPIKNKNAEKFGFFSKYLPEETLDLMKEISEKNQLDILWEQITIQYAAIIRAQRIMYVENKEEMIKELKKHETTEFGEKIEYEFQFAWDRQATFLNAQSRAMGELRSLIKQYESMINDNQDLATEEQKLRIETLKSKLIKEDSNKAVNSTAKLDSILNQLEGEDNE